MNSPENITEETATVGQVLVILSYVLSKIESLERANTTRNQSFPTEEIHPITANVGPMSGISRERANFRHDYRREAENVESPRRNVQSDAFNRNMSSPRFSFADQREDNNEPSWFQKRLSNLSFNEPRINDNIIRSVTPNVKTATVDEISSLLNNVMFKSTFLEHAITKLSQSDELSNLRRDLAPKLFSELFQDNSPKTLEKKLFSALFRVNASPKDPTETFQEEISISVVDDIVADVPNFQSDVPNFQSDVLSKFQSPQGAFPFRNFLRPNFSENPILDVLHLSRAVAVFYPSDQHGVDISFSPFLLSSESRYKYNADTIYLDYWYLASLVYSKKALAQGEINHKVIKVDYIDSSHSPFTNCCSNFFSNSVYCLYRSSFDCYDLKTLNKNVDVEANSPILTYKPGIHYIFIFLFPIFILHFIFSFSTFNSIIINPLCRIYILIYKPGLILA